MHQNRTFTETISLPASTPPGIYELKTTLDSEFSHASGFCTYVNKNGGISTFQLGLRDAIEVYASATNINHWSAAKECPKSERMTPCTIPCTGRQLTILIILPTTLTMELNVDVVFALESESRAR